MSDCSLNDIKLAVSKGGKRAAIKLRIEVQDVLSKKDIFLIDIDHCF